MKKLIFFTLGILIFMAIVAVATAGYAYTLTQPVSPQVAGQQPVPGESIEPTFQRFTIPKGQSVTQIGERLHSEGLIQNPLIFKIIVKKDGLAGKIQAGSFEISPSMNTSEVAQALTKGTSDAWITIPEGWRREEIADSLEKQELEEFDKEEFLQLTKGIEGQIYPDTYLVPRLITTQALVDLFASTFEKKVLLGLADDFEESDYTPEEIMVMASIVEREARGYEQMQQVAGILWNRIDIGMALQADATLQYQNGFSETQQSWWVPPRASDKEKDSVFNTYQNPGLPPRPISNPGAEAIEATLNPIESDYIFYIHDNQGNIHFATTLDQHNANINKYLR